MMKIKLTFLAVALCAGLLTISGCATTGNTGTLSPGDAGVIAETASSFGASAWLVSHPQDKPLFEATYAALGTLTKSTNVTAADLRSALVSLPIKEFKGEKGALIVSAVVTVEGLLANRVDVDKNAYVAAVTKGLFNGFSSALGHTP